jgi:hypothetical protein
MSGGNVELGEALDEASSSNIAGSCRFSAPSFMFNQPEILSQYEARVNLRVRTCFFALN